MKLLNFKAVEGSQQAGVLVGDRVHSLGGRGYSDVKSVLEAGPAGLDAVRDLVDSAAEGTGLALSDVQVLAPLDRKSVV